MMATTEEAISFSGYVKASHNNALSIKVNVYSKKGNVSWFTEVCLQEVLSLANQEAYGFMSSGKSSHFCIKRSGSMRVLCVFRQKKGDYKILVKCEDSKELANHLLNVSFIQIRGKNIIPYMENFHTTKGHYKCLSLVPHELCVYVDENELTSVDGIIRKHNSLNPDSPITNTTILSYFHLSCDNHDNPVTSGNVHRSGENAEQKDNTKKYRKLKNPKRSNQLEIGFKPAKKPTQRSLPGSEESPEEIVIPGEEEEFPDNEPDSIFNEVSIMLDSELTTDGHNDDSDCIPISNRNTRKPEISTAKQSLNNYTTLHDIPTSVNYVNRKFEMTDKLVRDFSSDRASPSVVDLSVADDDDVIEQQPPGGSSDNYNGNDDASELEKFNKLVEQVDRFTGKPSPEKDPLQWMDGYLSSQSSKQSPAHNFYGTTLRSSPQSSPLQNKKNSPQMLSSPLFSSGWIQRTNNKEIKNLPLSRKRKKKITAPTIVSRKLKPPTLKQQTPLTIEDPIQLIDDTTGGSSDNDILTRSNDRLRALREMENFKQANRSKGRNEVFCVDLKHDDDLVIDEDDGSINEVVPVSSGDEDNAVSMSIARKQVPGPKTRAKIKEILNSYNEKIESVSTRTIRQWVILRKTTFVEIFRGQIPTRRHEAFHKGAIERKNLANDVSSAMYTNEQYTKLVDCLNEMFCSKDNENFDYMYLVIVPEAIIYMLMDFYDLNYEQAEYKMFHYAIKSEKDC